MQHKMLRCGFRNAVVVIWPLVSEASMKVALARSYRLWMLVLLPATLGVGSMILWIRARNWPREIDASGLLLGGRRILDWESITKIGVSRNYRDGHISEVRLHYKGGESRIPVRALERGDKVARAILTTFTQMERLRARRKTFKRAARAANPPIKDAAVEFLHRRDQMMAG
jgi:hypothetical protein